MRKFVSKIARKVSQFLFKPSPRARVRRVVYALVLLSIAAFGYIQPATINKGIDQVNNGLARIPHLSWKIPSVPVSGFQLGLDLQGGAHLVYQADVANLGVLDRQEAMYRLRDRIERRVNALGVSEPRVQVSGTDRLVVELAGVDVQTAIERIGKTPALEFREESSAAPQKEISEQDRREMDEFNGAQKKKAEDARAKLATGKQSFEDLAKEVSEDPESRDKGGDLGSVTSASHPELIEAARKTIIGRVVPGVVDAPDGYYILRVDNRKEDDVEMQVSHILICYRGSTQCQQDISRDEALAKIKDIAKEVNTRNFEEKAKQYSNDPSAAVNGGDLGWIAPSTTVKAFEEGAKAIAVGTISQPVESDFGFHLIYKRDQRPYGETFLHSIFFKKKQPADYLPAAEPFAPTGLTGSNIKDAQLTFQSQTNAPQVAIQFDDAGTKMFADLTTRNLNKQIAIYLDGQILSAPVVQTVITNGQAVISGAFSIEEARDLARGLKDGALPVKVDLIQQQNIGASLGQEALNSSMRAGIIGLLLVVAFMLLYYRFHGFLAVVALGVYMILTLASFKLIGVTMTLSGIAGFLLSVGMAVDANVLVFERFREEREAGRDFVEAIETAFKRAWPSIFDGNVSTLITCAILALMGTSIIKGFAVTLSVGVLMSMFTAVVVTRALIRLIAAWRLKDWTILFGSGLRARG